MKKDEKITLKKVPATVGRLQLAGVHSTTSYGQINNYAVYAEPPGIKHITVKEISSCEGGHWADDDWDEWVPCPRGHEQLGEDGECVTDEGDFSVAHPWMYYAFVMRYYAVNQKSGFYLSVHQVLWGLTGPDQTESLMVWCPFMNVGNGADICNNASMQDVGWPTEGHFANVYSQFWASSFNNDNGYSPSTFSNKLHRNPEENELAFHEKWSKLSIDKVMAVKHSSAGFTLGHYLQEVGHLGPDDPSVAKDVVLDRKGMVKLVKDAST